MGIYQAPCQYPPLDTVCTRYQFSMSDLDHLVPNFPLTEGDVRLLAPACVSCLMTQAPPAGSLHSRLCQKNIFLSPNVQDMITDILIPSLILHRGVCLLYKALEPKYDGTAAT